MSAAVYEWTPVTGQLRRLYATDAALADCQPPRPDELICLRETSLRPRYLVAIDLTRGRVREVADPNPEFAGLTLGVVKRIKLKSSIGIPACADVVLPTDYPPWRHDQLLVAPYKMRD